MPIYNYAQTFWQRIAEEEKIRLNAYRTAWEYYSGAQPSPLKIAIGQTDDNVILNLYAYIIDKGISFLFGNAPDIELTEGEETSAEQYLEDVWQKNKLPTLLQNLALNGGTCGHVFLEIVPRVDDLPRLVNVDPAIIRPHWNPDDLEDVLWYKIEYEAIDEDGRGGVMRKRLIEKDAAHNNWIISAYQKRIGQPNYTETAPPVVWDYPFPPILDWQNLPAPNVYFGKRDIEQIAPQNGINFVASNMQRIIRFHGHPKTIGKGFNAENVNVGPDEMFVIPSKDGDVKNLEMQSDLSATREYFSLLVDLFLQLHHTPNLSPSNMNIGALSGFALKVLYGDLLALTNKKRNTYGDALKELTRRLLVLGNFDPQYPALHWQSPLPENEAEATDTAIKQVDAKLSSMETARAKLNLENETEQERIEAEALNANSIGSELLRAFSAGRGTTP